MSDEKFTSMEKTGQFGDKVMKPEAGNVDDLRRKLLYLENENFKNCKNRERRSCLLVRWISQEI